MGAAALASLSLSWQESWIARNGLDAELCFQSLSIPTDIAAHDLSGLIHHSRLLMRCHERRGCSGTLYSDRRSSGHSNIRRKSCHRLIKAVVGWYELGFVLVA
ncbi:hypothetical protein NC651_032133 [Populus alba x Populus x berolinensis]|nr:hypothetical protein NC651_032133 [Populus alba x Populus x berolinensis]